jgi:uncharacterized membrane protein YkoI
MKLICLLLASALPWLVTLGCAPSEPAPSVAELEAEAEPPDIEIPADAKPLAEIVAMLEREGYSPIAEIEYDDDGWEVEAYKNGERAEIQVDFLTGQILPDEPGETGKPLSEILAAVAGQGYGPILDVEFDGDTWEIEVYRDGRVQVLDVDAATGEITAQD